MHIREGNGNPLSTLAWKIPWMDAWWAAIYRVAQSDTTERLHFHFSLSCIGEGNGNPLQCSCLENPRDGGAWWAAVCGVTQSRTRLKQLSSSSSSVHILISCIWQYIYNEILLGHKKEWNNAIYTNMDGPRDHHTKWSKTEKDKYHMMSLICGILKNQYKYTHEQDSNAKVGSQEMPGLTGRFGLGVQNEAGQRLIEFCLHIFPIF